MDAPIEKKSMAGGALAVLIILILLLIVIIVIQKRKLSPQPVPPVVQTPQEPQKTDFRTKLPADFPADIPIEKGVKVEQSYSLNYAGQKQLTFVFQSTKTVKENYILYADFLKKQNWNVLSKYESPKISSLYDTKENSDINITISESAVTSSVKSQVSISILKK